MNILFFQGKHANPTPFHTKLVIIDFSSQGQKPKITCRELQMVKRYWNTIPVGSVTLRTPNTHVIPNNGKSTTQVRNTRLKKGISVSSNSHFLNVKTRSMCSRAREKRECMWELTSFPRGEAAMKAREKYSYSSQQLQLRTARKIWFTPNLLSANLLQKVQTKVK